MAVTRRWTSPDLEQFPDDGRRYEIIDGELFISDPRNWWHQAICGGILAPLFLWSKDERLGMPIIAPGIIFSESDDVAPDLIWASRARFKAALGEDGYLHEAPELIGEILMPGEDERREREAKMKLYNQQGVLEYWIVDWQKRQVDVFRRQQDGLELVVTLTEQDYLTAPLLPGFSLSLAELFKELELPLRREE